MKKITLLVFGGLLAFGLLLTPVAAERPKAPKQVKSNYHHPSINPNSRHYYHPDHHRYYYYPPQRNYNPYQFRGRNLGRNLGPILRYHSNPIYSYPNYYNQYHYYHYRYNSRGYVYGVPPHGARPYVPNLLNLFFGIF